jgi:hypothetical protein
VYLWTQFDNTDLEHSQQDDSKGADTIVKTCILPSPKASSGGCLTRRAYSSPISDKVRDGMPTKEIQDSCSKLIAPQKLREDVEALILL